MASRFATAAITTDQFMQLMKAIGVTQTGMDVKVQEFHEKAHQGQEEAAVKALKWARYENLQVR